MRRNGRTPKNPAFQFYPSDFLADPIVQAMSAAERGVYITLLCVQWIEGSVPDNPALLARICRETPEAFRALWEIVGTKFQPGPEKGTLLNPRLERERDVLAEYQERRSEAGKAANASRWSGRKVSESDPNRIPIGSQSDPNAIRSESDRSPNAVRSSSDSIPPQSPIPDVDSDRQNSLPPPPPLPGGEGAKVDEPPKAKKAKKTKAPRAEATGPQAEIIQGWIRLWQTHHGEPWKFTRADAVAASVVLELASGLPAVALERAERLIRHPDTFFRTNASLGLLAKRWNHIGSANKPAPSKLSLIHISQGIVR